MRPAAQQTTSELPFRLKFILGFSIGLILAASLAGGYWLRQAWRQLPAVDHLNQYSPALPLRIYSSEGILLAEYGEERRQFLPIEKIPLVMRQALLAIEDARFYEHGAVDFTGLLRATLANLGSGRQGQGASTISMQVARSFFLTREKTLQRKLNEILLSYKLEQRYSKDKLLELYMNQIYLGERSYGFAAASNIYFDKPLEQISVAEAAMLAGLPKAPSAYNPVANPQRAATRQHYILQRMLELGYIKPEAYQQAMEEKLILNPSRNSSVQEAAYAVEEARQLVMQLYQERAYTMGLDVTTTIQMAPQLAADKQLRSGLLDAQGRRGYRGPEAQLGTSAHKHANSTLNKLLLPYPDSGEILAALVTEVSPKQIKAVLRNGRVLQIGAIDPRIAGGWAKLPASGKRMISVGSVIRTYRDSSERWLLSQAPEMEGALISVDAKTGDILALAGGFDFFRNPFNHALQAYRQPGSSFKPFVYSAALEKGYFPGTMVDDTQRVLLPQDTGARSWRPRNFGDNYEGFITVRRGLMRSKNLVAVSLMQASGAAYVQEFATQFSFLPERNPVSLPLALGAGAVTPLQLAQSYAVFANGGYAQAPRLIKEIRDRSGQVLFADSARKNPGKKVVSARNAYIMDSMLQDVVKAGTGHGAKVLARGDTAGKTGTSNNAYDAWFAGYSSGVVSVVWLGYDQPKSLGNTTGGVAALPIWSRYMQVAVKDRNEYWQEEPAGLSVVDGDYVYSEYLMGSCVADSYPFIHSKLTCQAGGSSDLTLEKEALNAAQEREQILKLFSS
ncbi:penicillin-binding protein 1A [Solimicrobium silvestre]|uniref:Penicillin-binding protein 1A n=1 Tax=Solimicrobium silvestre TaxID=2099400 RepID=A0A2S9H1M0_9BURK|nr:PBP1A family penicillin-binding protein [Solimicrobium silvestre]PRC93850.1 Penicillin-binding protein, 1A family [Solimicrobium silvestre]